MRRPGGRWRAARIPAGASRMRIPRLIVAVTVGRRSHLAGTRRRRGPVNEREHVERRQRRQLRSFSRFNWFYTPILPVPLWPGRGTRRHPALLRRIPSVRIAASGGRRAVLVTGVARRRRRRAVALGRVSTWRRLLLLLAVRGVVVALIGIARVASRRRRVLPRGGARRRVLSVWPVGTGRAVRSGSARRRRSCD